MDAAGSCGTPDVLGVLCLANRPSHTFDQLGRVVIAGQVLRLNVLVEDFGVLLGAAVGPHDDLWHSLFRPIGEVPSVWVAGRAGKEEGKPASDWMRGPRWMSPCCAEPAQAP